MPTRTSDLRFLVIDEAERLCRSEHEIVLRKSVTFDVVEQGQRSTKVAATFLVVTYPLIEKEHPGRWDPKVVEKIRDLVVRDDGSVIADL